MMMKENFHQIGGELEPLADLPYCIGGDEQSLHRFKYYEYLPTHNTKSIFHIYESTLKEARIESRTLWKFSCE